jgi:endonuclease YncB( thermonuclease family)
MVLKTLITAALIVCSIHCWCQQSPTESRSRSHGQVDFSQDPCGNPLVESEIWFPIEGRVSKVVSGDTVLLTLPDSSTPLKVRIAGVSVVSKESFAQEAKATVELLALQKPMKILVNPSRWIVLDERPHEVSGVVHVKGEKEVDLALALIQQGHVRFNPPPPHTMSNYQACQYRRAEEDARTKKLGVWN